MVYDGMKNILIIEGECSENGEGALVRWDFKIGEAYVRDYLRCSPC